MHELWKTLAGPRGLTVDQIDAMEQYLVLLREANEVMNLTRVTDPEQGRIIHVADALTLLEHIPPETKLLADVGSGGGVPGIILAIALPETKVVLIESTQKKAAFLRETSRALGARNVQVRPDRAEFVGRSDLRDACDVVTARAVGPMNWLLEWCLPLVRKGGKLLAMKGPRLAAELPEAERALHACHGGPPVIHPVTSLPGQDAHVICEIAKLGRTDPTLPRDVTLAKGKPL